MRRRGENTRLIPGGKAAARLWAFRVEHGLTGTLGDQATTGYAKAIEEKERQIAGLDPKSPLPRWSPLGPFSIPHGQTYGSAQPSVSGRISCIAIDPTDPAHILVGSAAGGIWETKDDGFYWHPASAIHGEFPLAIGAIAFVPGQGFTVYAGTGEGNSLSDYGVGLWKSTDGGTSWAVVATDRFLGLGFYTLLVDPLDFKHLMAATTGGLYQSVDGGQNWMPVQLESPCWDISMHTTGGANPTNEVFAATPRGLYQSPDGGTNWEQVSLVDAPDSFERLAVCHDPSGGEVAYAFSRDRYGVPALWRRPAFGARFERAFCPKGIDLTQITYDCFVAVSPANPNVVYLGAISLWKGELFADGTWKWSNISSRQQGDSIHPDQHAIAFRPKAADVVYVGNDGGIFKSPNGGINWQSLNKGMCITHFEYIAQHPEFDAWLLGGTQDNGTLRYEGGEVWYRVADGDGGECGANSSFPFTVYHCYYDMTLERSMTGGGFGSWTSIAPQVGSGYLSLFYPPMEVNGNVVVQAGQSIFVSTDTGSTFRELFLPADAGTATALSIATPFKFFVGTESGDLFQFDWTGSDWANSVTLQQPRAGFISSIRTHAMNPKRVWVTYSDIGGPTVYRTDDGGQVWQFCTKGLPVVAVNILETDPSSADLVYVGTDVGVWRSSDSGTNWTIFSSGLPNVIVGDLLFHPVARVLRAATRSRGVWEIDLSRETATEVQVYLRHSPVDTGRNYPSLAGVPNPFQPTASANWWDSTDILIDSHPYRHSSVADVDFVAFEEDRRSDLKAAYGLTRIFVQVHQRGSVPATNVVVRLFSASAGGENIPDLPPGFWDKFPSNTVPADSAWSAIGTPVTLAGIQEGQPKVAALDWTVPETASGDVWLLAIVTAGNDKLNSTELNVSRLVQNQAKCGLKLISILA